MDEFLPERPALLVDFVLVLDSEDLLLNLWIADPHTGNSTRNFCKSIAGHDGVRKIEHQHSRGQHAGKTPNAKPVCPVCFPLRVLLYGSAVIILGMIGKS